jgi:hypothetical protein
MSLDLEAELTKAFAARASAVPPDAAARLRAVDYHPRTRRVSPRFTVGALTGAAAVGTVISVAVLGSAQAAFAGWSATPMPAASPPAAANANCQASLASMPALFSGSNDTGPWAPVATDVRGPYTVVIYQDNGDVATCFAGPSFTVVNHSATSDGGSTRQFSSTVQRSNVGGSGQNPASGGGFTSVEGGRVASGGVQAMSVEHFFMTNDGPYTLVEGQIDSGITGVTLVRSDGVAVEATTAAGWFVAWWPGDQNVTSGQITSASGVTTVPLPFSPPASAPSGGPCTPPTTSTVGSCGGSTVPQTGGSSSSPSTNVAG